MPLVAVPGALWLRSLWLDLFGSVLVDGDVQRTGGRSGARSRAVPGHSLPGTRLPVPGYSLSLSVRCRPRGARLVGYPLGVGVAAFGCSVPYPGPRARVLVLTKCQVSRWRVVVLRVLVGGLGAKVLPCSAHRKLTFSNGGRVSFGECFLGLHLSTSASWIDKEPMRFELIQFRRVIRFPELLKGEPSAIHP